MFWSLRRSWGVQTTEEGSPVGITGETLDASLDASGGKQDMGQ
jgi:hypothetical protein